MKSHESPHPKRALVARAFTVIEDIVYVGLGLLLAGSALVLLVRIRRVLVLTAQFADVHDQPDAVFQHFIIELAVLTVLIVALVVSLILLKQRGGKVVAERAT